MINKFLERRRAFKKFKKDVEGIFDDWKFDGFCLEKDEYSLWVCNSFPYFRDYASRSKDFLRFFNNREKKILWKEVKKSLKNGQKTSEGNNIKIKNKIISDLKK